MCFGVPSVPTETDATEEYDGTSWAAGGAYPILYKMLY
jgi:hypothetical protein